MAKKITSSEIIEDNLYANAIASTEALIVKNRKLLKSQREIFKEGSKAAKAIKFDSNVAKAIDKISAAEKKLIDEQKKLIKVEKEQTKLQKQLIQQTDEQVKAKLRFAKANKEQKDELKDLIVTENKQAGTLELLETRNRKLARERQKLNLNTEKGKQRLKEINRELDKNNKKIKQNSDQLKKQRLNVGGYTTAIREAAASSSLFGGVLFKLGQIQAIVTAFTKKDNTQKEISTANTFKQIIAEKSLTRAKRVGLVAQKALNAALSASIIGAVIIALAALIATFTRTQKNVDRLSDALSAGGAILDIFIDRLSLVGDTIIKAFDNAGSIIDNLSARIEIRILKIKKALIGIFSFEIPPKFIKGVKIFDGITIGVQNADKKVEELDKRIEKLRKQISDTQNLGLLDSLKKAFEGIGDEIQREIALAAQFNRLRRELNREQKIFTAQLAVETTINKNLRRIVVNKLNDDRERLKVQEQINASQIKLAEKQIELGERDVALSIDSVKLSGERLAFIEKIKNGQIDTNEAIRLSEELTLSSAAGEATLFNIVEKIVKLEQDRQKLADQLATSEKAISRIKRDIAAKEAKGLLVVATVQLRLAKQLERTDEQRLESLIRFEEATIRSFKVQLEANIITLEEFTARRIEAEIKVQEEIARINERQTKSEQELLQQRLNIRAKIAEENATERIREFNEDELFNLLKFKQAKQALDERKKAEIEAVILKNSILLENEKLTSDDIVKIKEQEAEEIRLINKKALEDKEKLDKKAAELSKQLAKDGIDFLIRLDRKKSQEKIDALDAEIEAAKRQTEAFRKAAQDGIADQDENIAISEKRESEARARKAQEIKKQQRDELKLVFLQLVASHAQSGSKNPFLAAIADLVKTEAFLNSFKDGTDDTGTVSRPLDSDGGRKVIVHNNEAIYSKENRAEMDNAPRQKVIDNYKIAEKFKSGELQASHKELSTINVYKTNNQNIQGFDRLEKAINKASKNAPKFTGYYSATKKAMIEEMEHMGNKQRNIIKVGGGGIVGKD